MIDRAARDKVLKLLTSYMDGKKKMQNLDFAVFDLEQTSDDELIALAGQIIWRCIEHGDSQKRFEGDRELWNLLCRLKLLLAGNVDLKARKVKRRHALQPVALLSLLVLFPLMLYVGTLQNGAWFWCYMLLCGLWTAFLSRKHDLLLERFNREEIRPARVPFNSFGEILAIRRSVPSFRKPPFPTGFPERSIDQEEPPGPFGRICQGLFIGFLFFVLWFGPLIQLLYRDERIAYEFHLSETR